MDWAMPVAHKLLVDPSDWVQALAGIAAAIAAQEGVEAPVPVPVSDEMRAIANSLLGGERKVVLLGNAAAHHGKASSLLALANWIGTRTRATVGYLCEASNTVGAQVAGVFPGSGGQNAGQMLAGGLKALILLNTEPEFDSAAGVNAKAGLASADMVVSLNPFKANMDFADVVLPVAPFTETSGSFVNAEARVQSFHAVVKPLAETRPAWKVLRVLANLLGLPGFDFDSSQDVLRVVPGVQVTSEGVVVAADRLSNSTGAGIDLSPALGRPVSAAIYQLDGLVRRSVSLQLTADAQLESGGKEVVA